MRRRSFAEKSSNNGARSRQNSGHHQAATSVPEGIRTAEPWKGLWHAAGRSCTGFAYRWHRKLWRRPGTSSAEELKEALAQTVATSYSVFKGETEVANGSLGSNQTLYLPEGDYRVELDSTPTQIMDISLAPRDQLTLTLKKEGGFVSHDEHRDLMEHRSCEDVVASIERLEADVESQESLRTATH